MVKVIESVNEIPAKGIVVMDFYANWCGPCKRIAPAFETLAGTFKNATFLKVNVDESPDLTEQFDVNAMPTFVFLVDGKLYQKVEGADLNQIIAILQNLSRN
jgi:thioredoxin 1